MPQQYRHKKSYALLFNQSKDETQQVKDRRRIADLEKQLNEIKSLLINKLEGKNEQIKEVT